MHQMTVELVQVNVGQPAELYDARTGRTVLSGIGKHTVTAPRVRVGTTNIEGDGQGDLVNHGGVDKAVYCYSLDHLSDWMQETGYGADREAAFGENLTLRGLVESEVHIGDQWQWGDVILEVAQPRWPCFKLGLHSDHRDLPSRLIATERSGWYCRVLNEGNAPTTGNLTLIHRWPLAPTVRDAFRAAKGETDADLAEKIVTSSSLAERWRTMVLTRYRKTASGT